MSTTNISENLAQTVEQVEQQVQTLGLAEFSMDKMQSFFDAAEHVLALYGSDAVNLGLNALRLDAFSQIIGQIIVILLLAFTLHPVTKFLTKFNQENQLFKAYLSADTFTEFKTVMNLDEKSALKYPQMDRFWNIKIRVGLGLLLPAMYSAFFILNLLNINIWAWAGLFYPELYAVHKFLL